MSGVPWHPTSPEPPLPSAPSLEDCWPDSFSLVAATGVPTSPVMTVMGVLVDTSDFNFQVVVDLDGLDATAFLANPVVLWYHEPHHGSIGRATRLFRDAAGQLTAIVRFHRTNHIAQNVYQLLNGRAGVWGVSIGIEHHSKDETWDPAERLLTIRKAVLREVSIVGRGADAGAHLNSGGRIVLRVTG